MTDYTSTAENFGALSKSTVDAAVKFANVSFESLERLFALNLDAAKTGFDTGAQNAKALASIKDVQELNGVRTKAAENSIAFAMGYGKDFYAVASATQAQYADLVEQGVSTVQKSLAESLDKAAKSAPTGADVFVTALKTGLAASVAATDSVTKAAKQMTTFADSAFKTASETAEKATKPAAKRK